MLTPKKKAYLKGIAHSLKACFQIGKDGLSDNLRNDLLKHELMKVSILNNSSVTIEEVEAYLEEVGIELVQKIGRVLVLYKHSDDVKNPIQLPLKK